MGTEEVFLYVEDDPLSREVMQMIVEIGMSKQVAIFENSANFMNQLRALPKMPTVILLDIHMEPYDGFELLEMLLAEPDYVHIPVVALTASVMNEEVERLRTSGFSGAIAKPLSVQTFPNLVTRIINGETIWHIIDTKG
jgi:CheY-like chemotaxis protein